MASVEGLPPMSPPGFSNINPDGPNDTPSPKTNHPGISGLPSLSPPTKQTPPSFTKPSPLIEKHINAHNPLNAHPSSPRIVTSFEYSDPSNLPASPQIQRATPPTAEKKGNATPHSPSVEGHFRNGLLHTNSASTLSVPSPLGRSSTKPHLDSQSKLSRTDSNQKVGGHSQQKAASPDPNSSETSNEKSEDNEPKINDRRSVSPNTSATNVLGVETSRVRSLSTERRTSGESVLTRSRSNTRNSAGNLNVTVTLSRRSSLEEDDRKKQNPDNEKQKPRKASAISISTGGFHVDPSLAASNSQTPTSGKRRKSSIVSFIRGLTDDSDKRSKGPARSLKELSGYENFKYDTPLISSEEILSTYVPEFVRKRFANATEPLKEPEFSTFFAAVLFADISGFTPFAERLCSKGSIGVEMLIEHLNAYFDQLIGLVEMHGGDILKFAGDAVLVVWYGEEDKKNICRRATQCAMDIQQHLNNYDFTADKDRTKLDMFSLSEEVSLRLHIGIGAGEISAFHVGGVDGRWEFLIGGHPLVQFAVAVEVAEPGEVVLSQQAWDHVRHSCIGIPTMSDCYVVTSITSELDQQSSEFTMISENASSMIGAYVPQSVHYSLGTGQVNLMGELRRVTVLFIQLPDLNVNSYSSTAKTMLSLQNALVIMQKVIYLYEGTVRQFMIDDKGCVLIAAFGLPPFSHENDCERAVRTAMKIRQDLQASGYQSKIGVTTGRAFCGSIGNYRRQEYALVGDIVNLSARLMSASRHFGILCDLETKEGSMKAIQYETIPAMAFKGKSGRIQIYRPAGFISTDNFSGPNKMIDSFVGRLEERDAFDKKMDELLRGKGGLLFIQAEAGAGKSHLLAEYRRMCGQRKIKSYRGCGDSLEHRSQYFGWRSAVMEMLGISEIKTPDKIPDELAEFLQTCAFDLISDAHRQIEPKYDNPSNAVEPGYPMDHRNIGSTTEDNPHPTDHADPSMKGFRPELVRYLKQQGSSRRALEVSETPTKGDGSTPEPQSPSSNDSPLPPAIGRKKVALPPIRISKSISINSPSLGSTPTSKEVRFDSVLNAPEKSNAPIPAATPRSLKSFFDFSTDSPDQPGSANGGNHLAVGGSSDLRPTTRKRSSSTTSVQDGDRRRSKSFLTSMMTLPTVNSMSNMKDDTALQLAPLFNSILQLDLPENEVTKQLTVQSRVERLTILLFRLLRKKSLASPFIIMIDDAQWLDSVSWGLIYDVCSQLQSVLMVVAMRPFKIHPNSDVSRLMQNPNTSTYRLQPMKEEEMYQMLCTQLKITQISIEIFRLVFDKSQGNPFFASELISVLKEDGDLVVDEKMGSCVLSPSVTNINKVRLPETLEAVVTNRIDRLSASEQLTLKVASVIGRRFSKKVILSIYPAKTSEQNIENDIKTLEQMEFIVHDEEEGKDSCFSFRNVLTQDVAYNLFPFLQRQKLHLAIAEWHEQNLRIEEINPICHILAFHWSRAQNDQKAAKYLEMAGERAFHSGQFDEVIQYFHELVTLNSTANLEIPDEKLARWQRNLGNAQYQFGDLQWARHHLEKASHLLRYNIPQGNFARRFRSNVCMVRMLFNDLTDRVSCSNTDDVVTEMTNETNSHDQVSNHSVQNTESAIECSLIIYRLLSEVYLSSGYGLLYELAVRRFSLLAYKTHQPDMIILSRSFRCIGALISGRHSRAIHHRNQVLQAIKERDVLNAMGNWADFEAFQIRIADELEELESWQYWEEANILLAYSYLLRAQSTKCEELIAHILDSAMSRDSRRSLCWAFIILAELQVQRGQYQEALANVTNCTGILLEGLEYETFCVRCVSGLIAFRRGDMNEALSTVTSALSFYIEHRLAHLIFILPALHHIGEVFTGALEGHETKGNRDGVSYRTTFRQLQTVTEMIRKFSEISPIAKSAHLYYWGTVLWRKGKSQKALAKWKASASLSSDNNIPFDEALAYFELGLHTDGADRTQNLRLAHDRFQRLGDPHLLGKCQLLLSIREI